ncbi:MAG: family 10 glycosylhydrolase [Candidatus Sumerlaeota bacterium]|nr:family 10 glycosylhydrolase [Candidatus Sumerlaeota bacterium]
MKCHELSAAFLILAVWANGAALAQGIAAPPKPNWDVAPQLAVASTGEAQKLWKPMGESAPVEWQQPAATGATAAASPAGEKTSVFRMRCNFKGMTDPRASWDIRLPLDLEGRQGIKFQFLSKNVDPVGNFSFFCQSGAGWYSATFDPQADGQWETIEIRKNAFHTEGKPDGWDKVQTIRISAWRSQDVDTEFCVANLGAFGEKPRILILRADSTGDTNEKKSIEKFCAAMAENFEALGAPCAIVGDQTLSAKQLEGISAVVLPHNPGLPEGAAKTILSYLGGGGRIMVFYGVPQALVAAIGVKPGAHVRSDPPGLFSRICFTTGTLRGAPDQVRQNSWNINDSRPIEGRARVAAWWYDAQGKNTNHAAVLISGNAFVMTHVLLDHDPVGARGMLMAALGTLAPQLASASATHAIEAAGAVYPFTDAGQLKEAIRTAAKDRPALLAELSKADSLIQQARESQARGEFAEAVKGAQQTERFLVNLYAQAQRPLAKEFRGFWCHRAFGVDGMTWDEAIRILAENGFTAIFPNMLWGGAAFYDSKVLPVAQEVKEKGDQIAACVAACKKYGVQCHVWKVNWNMGWATARDFKERMRNEGRTQMRFNGSPEDSWLCPSNPLNQKLEIDAMVEVGESYAVDGVHFDYIRYGGDDVCFCAGCRERFEKLIGRKVERWPADVRVAPLKEPWLEFRRSNITTVVRSVSETLRKSRPQTKISAAVFRNWPADRDSIGQDWKTWVDKGWLDFACPMDYERDLRGFDRMVRRQKEWMGAHPFYPGIGRSVWSFPNDIVLVCEEIKKTREIGTGGFMIFNYSAPEAAETVPMCGKGITRKSD